MDIYYLLESICDAISKTFPNHDIYINDVSQGFCRPSFYVSLVSFNNEDLVKGELNKNTTFEIVYFSPIDDRGQCDKLAQHVSHIKLTDIFSTQALTVDTDNGPIRVKITGLSGGPRDAEVYLTVDFNYSFIPDNNTNPEELYYLMQELQLRYKN